MTWKEAFRTQALSDLELYETLAGGSAPRCHALHFLQMASEKAAKARLASIATGPPPFSHKGAGDLVRVVLANDEPLGRALGYASRGQRLQAVRALAPTASAVESLAPAIANSAQTGVNAEYPWSAPDGLIVAPSGHAFNDPALSDLKLALFARFLRAFLERI